MANIFDLQHGKHADFKWRNLGDIAGGRVNLGTEMPVLVYRMQQYSVNSVLVKRFGQEVADEVFREAGHVAGVEFARNMLPMDEPFDRFVVALQNAMLDNKVGILRVEQADMATGTLTLTVQEDLDCSGLDNTEEVVCHFDEGFIDGILEAYTGTKFDVREVDCWSNGGRICRFKGRKVHDDEFQQ